MLQIQNLSVEINNKQILHNVNLNIGVGETHVLFGPNASGKTSLLMTIMGFPKYKIVEGKIFFKGRDITLLPLDERSRLGIGLAFQRPPVVRGVKMRDIAKACLHDREDGAVIEALATRLNLTELLDREINYGFSGGETKRSELLQLLSQSPDLVLLDEPESGVDLVSIALVGEMINELLQKELMRTRTRAGLIITHTGHILNYVNTHKGYLLINGRLCCEGNPQELLNDIRKSGYERCAECRR